MLIPLLFVSAAHAAEGAGRATIVWMQPDLPAEETRQKAEKLVGTAAVHAAWGDLAFPPTPFAKDDEARLAALDRATADAKKKWDAFDAEREIAAGLGAAVAGIDALRDEADRKLVARALLLQGAASLRIVPEASFATAEAVAPYRAYIGSGAVVKPFVDALALEPDAVWTREDVQDATAFTRLGADRDAVSNQAQARLEIAELPAGVSLVVDGRPLTGEIAALAPGRHYVHAVVDGKIAGRRTVEAAPGATLPFEPVVSRGELDAASQRVLEGSREVPEDVAKAVTTAGTRNGALTPTFLATLDEKGKVQLVPYAGGAAFQKKSPVTVLLAGSVGGGILVSPAFVGAVGTPTNGFGVGGNLGAEVGIYNLAVYGGTTLFLTPTEQMKFANAENTENIETNAFFRPYGGLGVYLPRPDAKKPPPLLCADHSWMSPSAMGLGGR
ncbi:MAG: hypothetical protein ACK4YP_05055, partial [Myxococcota bacterium]